MDIGTEELSHLEIVGAQLGCTNPMKFDRDAADADPQLPVARGGGVNLYNSMGNAWHSYAGVETTYTTFELHSWALNRSAMIRV